MQKYSILVIGMAETQLICRVVSTFRREHNSKNPIENNKHEQSSKIGTFMRSIGTLMRKTEL